MRVRQATNQDKSEILDFCKNTFSWGDYIAQVWQYWLREGHLLVIEEDSHSIGICHASHDLENQNMWIEGIRIRPQYRRKGFAKNLISHCEKISKQKNCKTIQMLIDIENSNSLMLSKAQGYKITETWDFHSFEGNASLDHTVDYSLTLKREKTLSSFSYIDSWRRYMLTRKTITNLAKQRRIIFSNSVTDGIAIISESRHFHKTLLVSILSGDHTGISNILSEITSLSQKHGYENLQIMTQLRSLSTHKGLNKKMSFHLVEKSVN